MKKKIPAITDEPFEWDQFLLYLRTGRALEDHADIAIRVMINTIEKGEDFHPAFKEYLHKSFRKYLDHKNISLDQAFGLTRKKAGQPKRLPASVVGLPSHVYLIWQYLVSERTNMDWAVEQVSKKIGVSKSKLKDDFKFYKNDLASTILLEKYFQKKDLTPRELEMGAKYISKRVFSGNS